MDLKELMRRSDPAELLRRVKSASSVAVHVSAAAPEDIAQPLSDAEDVGTNNSPDAADSAEHKRRDSSPPSAPAKTPVDLRAIMQNMDSQALLARIRGKDTQRAASVKQDELEPMRPIQTTIAIAQAPAPKSGTEEPECSVWKFFVEPVAATIAERTRANPLLPIFVVENPYPNYSDYFKDALKQMCASYRLIQLDGINEERLANLAVQLTASQQEGVILFCTSRAQLHKDFRSLVRSDGYLSIPSLNFERMQQYAARCRTGIVLTPEDGAWIKWIGPQELLFANGLGDGHWIDGLRQLASQHSAAQVPGHSRKLKEMYGVEVARNWAEQLFNDLALAREGKIGWDEVDRGALLAGPPGTGKTTLARAIATESGANFIAVSAVKDWMSGNGLDEAIKLMATTFSIARQQAPSIIFIDEIDSVGNREEFTGQNASWNTAFLNALLTEMDGFDDRRQVIVIGATNHPENIDGALKRAGRLDRVIRLSRPGVDALADMYRGMLKVYSNDLSEVDFRDCAASSLGLTGADVEVLVRGARRRARLDGYRAIQKADVIDEIYRIPPDAERRPLSKTELENTAYHEAGHALVGLSLETTREQVRMASIIADNDGALGFVAVNQREQNETRASLLDRICMSLAGRAAEENVYGKGNVSTGAGGGSSYNDLAIARRLAEAYVGVYGFSEKHPNWYATENIEDEAANIVSSQFNRAAELIKEKRTQLEDIAQSLLLKHILTYEDLMGVMEQNNG